MQGGNEMARTVRYAKLDSRTARAKLKKGRQPHWQELQPRTHLGYQRQDKKPDGTGRWLLRRYLGSGNKYRIIALGIADDCDDCDGVGILNFDQAKAKALSMVEIAGSDRKVANLTVRQAMDRYIRFKESEGQPVEDIKSRGAAHTREQAITACPAAWERHRRLPHFGQFSRLRELVGLSPA
jgi:hypothetical protein